MIQTFFRLGTLWVLGVSLAIGAGCSSLAAPGISSPAPAVAMLVAGGIVYEGWQKAGHSYSIRKLTPERFLRRSDEYPIFITGNDYKEPYMELAIVTTKAYDDRILEVAGKADLERMARRLGGDAVVRVVHNGVIGEEFGYRPGNLTRLGARFQTLYTLTGVVVRFKRDAEGS